MVVRRSTTPCARLVAFSRAALSTLNFMATAS
jgi:hypothetical protein